MVILLVVEDPITKTNSQSAQNTNANIQNGEYFRRGIHIDLTYFKTLPGILKIIQFIIIIIIKVVPSPPYMDFVVQITFILTSLWIWIYIFSLTHKYTITPTWIDLEFFYTLGATVLYAVMTIISFADASYYIRAAIFGLFNSITFGFGSFLLFKQWMELRQIRIGTTQQSNAYQPNNSGYI